MANSALAVANEFIRRSGQVGVSHMKLQKLVYLTLEEWFKTHNDSFLSENPQVWQYGPVFNGLYHELKSFRSHRITEPQKRGDKVPVVGNKKDVQKVIDTVWGKYKDKTAVQLSDLTHEKGSPWWKVAKKHDFDVPFGTEISPKQIIDFVR